MRPIKLPIIVTVNGVKILGSLEKGRCDLEGNARWYIEIAESQPTAASLVFDDNETGNQKARELANNGFDAGFYGGYWKDIIKYAQENGLIYNEIAEKIFQTLMAQKFTNWYSSGDFDKFIHGDEGAKSKTEILQDIIRLFHLNDK